MHSPEVTLWEHEFSEKKPLKVLINGKNILFVTYTLCQALSLSDPQKAMGYLKEGESTIVALPGDDGKEVDFHCVNVQGAYSLVFSSNVGMIHKFLIWFNACVFDGGWNE